MCKKCWKVSAEGEKDELFVSLSRHRKDKLGEVLLFDGGKELAGRMTKPSFLMKPSRCHMFETCNESVASSRVMVLGSQSDNPTLNPSWGIQRRFYFY